MNNILDGFLNILFAIFCSILIFITTTFYTITYPIVFLIVLLFGKRSGYAEDSYFKRHLIKNMLYNASINGFSTHETDNHITFKYIKKKDSTWRKREGFKIGYSQLFTGV